MLKNFVHLFNLICLMENTGKNRNFFCLSLRYSIVYYYNGAQRYEQFLQVG